MKCLLLGQTKYLFDQNFFLFFFRIMQFLQLYQLCNYLNWNNIALIYNSIDQY